MQTNRSFAASLLFAVVASVPAYAAPSSSLSLSGYIGVPGTFDLPALQALSQTTETETYTSAGSPVVDTFTGPTLWSVLQSAGGIRTNPANKNDILRKYIVATG